MRLVHNQLAYLVILVVPMAEETFERYWYSTFDTFRDVYYQELLSEALVTRWQRINILIGVLVALTASGSTISGLALWNTPGGKVIWGIIAGIAAVASIINGVIGVSGRIKVQEDLRREYSALRVDLETFLFQLGYLSVNQAEEKFGRLRQRFAQVHGRASPDVFHEGFLRRVQDRVNEECRRKGYVL